jgi:hypothetical protein
VRIKGHGLKVRVKARVNSLDDVLLERVAELHEGRTGFLQVERAEPLLHDRRHRAPQKGVPMSERTPKPDASHPGGPFGPLLERSASIARPSRTRP